MSELSERKIAREEIFQSQIYRAWRKKHQIKVANFEVVLSSFIKNIGAIISEQQQFDFVTLFSKQTKLLKKWKNALCKLAR